MTRDWKHMRTVLDRILTVWHEYPDLRLGQLLDVGREASITPNSPIFHIQDQVLMDGLERFHEKASTKVALDTHVE